jgi:hypothetical protein
VSVGKHFSILLQPESQCAFQAALNSSTAAGEQKLTIRLPNCVEAVEFSFKRAEDPNCNLCVLKSTRYHWFEVADSKVPVLLTAVDVLPGGEDMQTLWMSAFAHKMGDIPGVSRVEALSKTLKELAYLPDEERLWYSPSGIGLEISDHKM